MDWLMIIKNVVYVFIEPFFNCQLAVIGLHPMLV